MRTYKIIEKIIDYITIILGLYLLCVLPFQLPIYAIAPVELLGVAYILSGIHQLGDQKEEN